MVIAQQLWQIYPDMRKFIGRSEVAKNKQAENYVCD